MVGSTLNLSMGWSAPWITLLAGVLFVALTFVGIRAISWIGVVASVLFIPLGVVAVVLAAADDGIGSALSYRRRSRGECVQLRCRRDDGLRVLRRLGTMDADFTRWARNGREGALAAFAAFPVAYFIAQLVGALVVALGAAAAADTAGGDFLHVLVSAGGVPGAAGDRVRLRQPGQRVRALPRTTVPSDSATSPERPCAS